MDTDEFVAITLRNPVNEAIANELMRLALSDAWLVSGCPVANYEAKTSRWKMLWPELTVLTADGALSTVARIG
jgi:hypothetical protein